MAHLHFRRTVYKSGGSKAKARVEYIARESAKDLRAERHVRYIGRADREDLVYTQSRNLPTWANGNALTYFRAAEQYERANGNAFEEWKMTLPHELTPGQNMALMRDLVDAIAGDRLPITYAFHAPSTLSQSREQPHLHLLLSGRQHDGVVRTPAQHFKRANAKQPARGGAPKDPALNHLRAVKRWRVTISDLVNVHLERAGCADRIHPDSLEDRAIDRKPEPKLRPSESRAYRDKGVVSPRVAEVLATRAKRAATRDVEQADARAYWEARKDELGLTDAMEAAAQKAAISAARDLVRDQAPLPTREREASVLEARADEAHRLLDLGQAARDDAWHEAVLLWAEDEGARALGDVGWEIVQEAWEAGQEGRAVEAQRHQLVAQVQAWSRVEHDLQALSQQLDALHAGEGETGHMRIRLWEQDRGIGL